MQRPVIVIVAEDHDDTRELYVLALEKEGFIAEGVETVAAARKLIERVRVDVLVADYSLPDGTGADLMKLCSDAQPRVCVLLTGFDAEDVDATGFHVVLRKPVVGEQLVAAIRAHL